MEDEKKEMEELNDENDSREEDVVEDVDSDTRDVTEKEDTIESADSAIVAMVKGLSEKLDRIEADMVSLKDAQSVMLTDARIVDVDPQNDAVDTVDEFVPLSELDFSID